MKYINGLFTMVLFFLKIFITILIFQNNFFKYYFFKLLDQANVEFIMQFDQNLVGYQLIERIPYFSNNWNSKSKHIIQYLLILPLKQNL